MLRILLFVVGLCLVLPRTTPAQSQTSTPIIISLETASLDLQTGQTYEVNLRLDGAYDVWLVNAEINYDPTLIYTMGTKSGSPVRQGAMFDANNSVTIRNVVQDKHILYTLSMLAPASPVSGDGVVGSFRIYPIAPGITQLTFSRVTLNKVTQILENGTPVKTQSEDLPFTPVLLQLNITGNPVPIPSEATATPLPTETPFFATSEPRTLEPTLVNVTAAPRPQTTPTPDALAVPADSASNTPLIIALAIVIISGIGLVVLFVLWRRSQRRG